MDLALLSEMKHCKSARLLSSRLISLLEQDLLSPGEILPSSREIATFLQISRTTVARAFNEMEALGFFIAKQGQGTIVNSLQARHSMSFSPPSKGPIDWSNHYSALAESVIQSTAIGTDIRLIDNEFTTVDLTPLRAWKSLLASVIADEKIGYKLIQADAPFGYIPLREEISALLKRTNGILYPAGRIALYSNSEAALHHLCHLIIKPEDLIFSANPCARGRTDIFAAMGAQIKAAPYDRDGIKAEILSSMNSADWLYLNQSGASLSKERLNLFYRTWRDYHIAIIEEGDFAELPFGASPVSTFFSQNAPDAHILIYNFRQLLFPLSSVCCLILPESLVPLFERTKHLFDCQPARIENHILAELIKSGTLETHRYTAWKLLRQRKNTLIVELMRTLNQKIKLVDRNNGLRLTVRFDEHWTEDEILECAAGADLELRSTRVAYFDENPAKNEFTISFASLTAEALQARVEKFSQQLLYSQSRPAIIQSFGSMAV